MRTIPLAALQEMFKLSPGEFPITLLEISRGEDIIRLSSDATQRISEDPIVYGTISAGETYIYFPFELTLPQDRAESISGVKIQVENVSAEIGWWLRKSTVKPTATIKIISSGDLDNPIMILPDYDLASFQGGTMTIEGELILSTLESEPYPGYTFTPGYFPGLF